MKSSFAVLLVGAIHVGDSTLRESPLCPFETAFLVARGAMGDGSLTLSRKNGYDKIKIRKN